MKKVCFCLILTCLCLTAEATTKDQRAKALQELAAKRDSIIKKLYGVCLSLEHAASSKKKKSKAKTKKKAEAITKDLKSIGTQCNKYFEEMAIITSKLLEGNENNLESTDKKACKGDHYAAIRESIKQKRKAAEKLNKRAKAASSVAGELKKQCKEIEGWSKARAKHFTKIAKDHKVLVKIINSFIYCQKKLVKKQANRSKAHEKKAKNNLKWSRGRNNKYARRAKAHEAYLAISQKQYLQEEQTLATYENNLLPKLVDFKSKLTSSEDNLIKKSKKLKKVKEKFKKYKEKDFKEALDLLTQLEESWNSVKDKSPKLLSIYKTRSRFRNRCRRYSSSINKKIEGLQNVMKDIKRDNKSTLIKKIPAAKKLKIETIDGHFLGLTPTQVFDVNAIAQDVYKNELHTDIVHPKTRFPLWCTYKTVAKNVSTAESDSSDYITKSVDLMEEMLPEHQNRMVSGSLKVMAAHFQSCDVVQFAKQDKKNQCDPSAPKTPPTTSSPRTILKQNKKAARDPKCKKRNDRDLRYDYGSKFSYSRNTLNVLKQTDCSSFVSASMAAGGLNWSPGQKRAYESRGTANIDSVARGKNSCFEEPSMTPDSSLKPGDLINSTNDHVMIIQGVGDDPFGLNQVTSASGCKLLSPDNFDFSLSHSTSGDKLRNPSGVQTTHIKDLRAQRHIGQFTKMARGLCNKKFAKGDSYKHKRVLIGWKHPKKGERGTSKPRYFTIMRHQGRNKEGCVSDKPIKIQGAECIEDCFEKTFKKNDGNCKC